MSKRDYLKIPDNRITRVNASIFELSSVLTKTSKMINDSQDLSKFIESNGVINDIVNPSEVATRLFKDGKYDAYMKRDNEVVKFSDLYVNPMHYNLLLNYFNKQHKTVQSYIINKYIK